MNDLTVVVPEKNEDHKILSTIKLELESLGAEVIIVDDGSTVPFKDSIKHGWSYGYGSALMTGIKNSTREFILTMDGDGQHTVSEVVKLYHAFKLIGNADMVIGTRRLKDESLIRFLGRKFLNWTASIFCTYWLSDLNSGCRIFRRDLVLGYFPILCRHFSFTTSLTLSFMCDRHRVEFFPINIEKRIYGKTRVKMFKDGLVTIKYIFWIGLALRTRGVRKVLRKIPLWNYVTGKGWVSSE